MKLVFADAVELQVHDPNLSDCTIPLFSGRKIILVETDFQKMIPSSLGKYTFLPRSKEQIEREIKSNNGDCYLVPGLFFRSDAGDVSISLTRWMAEVFVDPKGKTAYPGRWVVAKGRSYIARKRKGRWNIRFVKATTMVS